MMLLLLLLRELIVLRVHVNHLRLPDYLLLLHTRLHWRSLLLHLLLLLPLHL